MAKRGWFWLALVVIAGVVAWQQRGGAPAISLPTTGDVVAFTTVPEGRPWTEAGSHPRVQEAADGTDPEALVAAMEEAGLRGLWVGANPGASTGAGLTLIERFTAGGIVRGFRGDALTADGFLYLVDDTEWPAALVDRVLARAARQILEGSEPPPLDAFPDSLTRLQPVEVLVLLVGGRGPRLWRSARAESIAEGLVTASLAARQRWEERMETMGGPLGERLDELDVHVAFLVDDGTFDARAVSMIDPLVKARHGVAYEQPSRWRYLLPRATHNAATPTDAYRRLFRDNGLPEDSFERRDLRLYRMRMRTVSVDQGSTGSKRTGAASGSPD